MDYIDRFNSKIIKNGECWIWQGFVDRDGYGLVRPATDEDKEEFDCCISFVFTQRGEKLYQSACKKLYNLGKKYFPDYDLDIKSSAIMCP